MSPLELDGYLTGIVVTPKAAPILPEGWIAHLWDEDPVFDDDLQIKLVLGPVINQYNALGIEIDRSLKRLETDKIVDYRPRFLVGDQKPAHNTVRAWVRGFWKAMALEPRIWNALIEDERTQVIIQPFLGFLDLGDLEPDDIGADVDILDEHVTLTELSLLAA
jgi:yecA family protein